MFSNKLKIYFTINIAFLLFFGMILIDLILVNTTQRELCKSKIDAGLLFISFFEENLTSKPLFDKSLLSTDNKYLFQKMMRKTDFSYSLFISNNPEKKYVFGTTRLAQSKLYSLTKKAMRSGNQSIVFDGFIWGVFWPQKEYLIISSPLKKEDRTIAGLSIVMPMNKIYQSSLQTQKMLVLYILINTFVLTIIGVRRFSMIVVKPLHSLLKRAEESDENDELFFLKEKDNNEFNQLSSALNRMLRQNLKDKTNLKKTVNALEKTNRNLKKAQKEIIHVEKLATIGRLSAGLAHEIGNPISIIIGYFDLLKREDVSDDEKREYIQRAENEINRINNIIRQFLDSSREWGEGAENISVHSVIYELVDAINAHAFMSDINVELLLHAEEDTVFVNSEQLRQVFMNLIINAADAISKSNNISNGKIIISSEITEYVKADSTKESSYLKIEFKDNGHGISKKDLDNIFDPFFTTKEPGKGTGLGLFVCFTIIEKYGGTIKASSEDGCGSKIIIYFPLTKKGNN